MAAASFKSKVLNLYYQDELSHFRCEPSIAKVQIHYKQGAQDKPVDFNMLSVQDVDVHTKMFDNESKFNAEQSRAIAEEQRIQGELDTEEARAASEESRIEGLFNAEKSRVNAQESLEAQQLAAETLAREQKDILIDAAIAQEANTRQAADTVHTQAIVDEKNRAEGEESRIEGKFDAYKTSNDSRATADEQEFVSYKSSNDTKLDDHIADFEAQQLKQIADDLTEKNRAEASEANLQTQITSVLSNTDAVALNSLAEIVDKFNTDGVGYAQRLTSLEAVVNALVEQLGN